MSIRFENVRKAFGSKVVLEDVGFEVGSGECFFIIGASGVGKSVLIKHLIGLLRPDGGSIYLDGDFEIEVEMWCNASSGRSVLAFFVGKKIGISWGQQLVKLGNLRPISPMLDRTQFREERLVRMKFSYKGEKLTVTCNGRKTAEAEYRKGELRGQFGLIAKDVRFQITDLKIRGMIDREKL